MQTDIIFFDIPSAKGRPFSPNTWKVRLALNIKKLQYKTHWVEYLDVKATAKAMGIPPSGTLPDGSPHHTFPAIIDNTNPENPVKVSDSSVIIEYLEKTYPTPGANLLPPIARPLLHFADQFIFSNIIAVPFLPLFVNKINNDFISPSQREGFAKMIQTRFGKLPSEFETHDEEVRKNVWEQVEKAFGSLNAAYDKSTGMFIVPGTSPTTTEVALVSWFILIREMVPEDWERVSKWHGGRWGTMLSHFEQFMAVDEGHRESK